MLCDLVSSETGDILIRFSPKKLHYSLNYSVLIFVPLKIRRAFHKLGRLVFFLLCFSRQANDGVWKKQDNFSNPSAKHNDDLQKFSGFDIPSSPPLTINDIGGGNSLSNWSPHSSLSRGLGNPSGSHKDNHPPIPHKGKALEELERRAAADKAMSMEVRLVRLIFI